MSETKWTPGPWQVFRTRGVTNGAHIISKNGNTIVARVPMKADKSIYQKDADLYLIAAAPELYEALEQARIFVADLPIVGDETLKKVDTALAKARGETP